MKRFPSSHGARVVFDPIRRATPTPGTPATRRSGPVPRAAPLPREIPREEREKPRNPSFAEVDVVEANLAGDPRYDGEDEGR